MSFAWGSMMPLAVIFSPIKSRAFCATVSVSFEPSSRRNMTITPSSTETCISARFPSSFMSERTPETSHVALLPDFSFVRP